MGVGNGMEWEMKRRGFLVSILGMFLLRQTLGTPLPSHPRIRWKFPGPDEIDRFLENRDRATTKELLRMTYLRKMKEAGWDDERVARVLIEAYRVTHG